MSIVARVAKLEKAAGVGERRTILLVLPESCSSESDVEEAKAEKLKELGLRQEDVSAWLILKGLWYAQL